METHLAAKRYESQARNKSPAPLCISKEAGRVLANQIQQSLCSSSSFQNTTLSECIPPLTFILSIRIVPCALSLYIYSPQLKNYSAN